MREGCIQEATKERRNIYEEKRVDDNKNEMVRCYKIAQVGAGWRDEDTGGNK